MKKWKETFSILIIGLSFIALILFIQPTIQNQTYRTEIPKSTISHYLINSYDLFKKLVFNELFIQKDEVISEKIKDLLAKETESKNNFFDLSIDLSKPIEIIRFQKDNGIYTAIKFKIDNIQIFENNKTKMNDVLIFRYKSAAFWIFGQPKNKVKDFEQFIKSNLFTYNIKNEQSKQLLSVFQHSKLTSKSTFELKGNTLLIVKKHLTGCKTYKRLLPKGFHFSTRVNRSDLSSFKNEKILNIIHSDALNYISINYDGLNFLDNDKLPLFPYFEIYLTYKNKIFGDSIVNQLIQHFNLPYTNESSNIFSFNGEKIKVKQIDTNQIVISTLKTEYKLEKTQLNPIFSGDPKKLIKVTNAGWKGLFLELIPGYKATKNFLESINEVSTHQNKNGEQIICLSFKQDTDALHSFLKFALSIQ